MAQLMAWQEMAARQEQIRRATLEFEAQLRQKTELERVKAETEGRILAERRNHDLRLEQVGRSAREWSRRLRGEGGGCAYSFVDSPS